MLRKAILGAALAVLVAVTSVVAQRGHRGGGRGVVVRGGFGPRVGVGVRIGTPHIGVRVGVAPRRHVRPVIVGVPVVAPFGYYSYGSYYSGYSGYSGITPYAAQAPVVVVQQQPAPVYVNPPPVYYSAPAPQPQVSTAPPSPMLVFKDRSVFSVLDYWVAGNQLHFLPSRGSQRIVPLETLDLDMTQKVNEACNIPFELKPR